MQLLPILLVAAVLAVDGGLRPVGTGWGLSDGMIAALAWGPVAATVAIASLGLWICRRRMERGHYPALRTAERLTRASKILIIANHLACVLVFGWVGVVRDVVGNPILLDEVIAILPPLFGLTAMWWAYYPIDRLVHQSILIRQLDEGLPVYPSLSRGKYVLLQVRIQLLLVLVPVLAIAGLSEVIHVAGERSGLAHTAAWAFTAGKIAAGAGVFMLAPLLARMVLDVKPMTMEPLRQKLLDVCARHRVKIRELLVWHTNGFVFNAAVMGLIGPLRYVMITDALLESMREDQVRAVMAHEIGHVRRHHMPWMVACLMASLLLVGYIIELPLRGADQLGWISQSAVEWLTMGVGGVELALALVIFGWVSRRFERQADTFAVQHLSGMSRVGISAAPIDELTVPAAGVAPGTITPESVHSMCDALDAVARLNAIDPQRPSWRHGSIAWRMEYLVSLIGRPIAALPIDRLVRRIKFATAAILALSFGLALLDYLNGGNVFS